MMIRALLIVAALFASGAAHAQQLPPYTYPLTLGTTSVQVLPFTRHFKLGHSLGSGGRDNVLDGLGNGIGTGLDHAVRPHEEFGVRVDGEPVKQGLQFGP
jgi:hypothetical protein